MSRNLHKTVTNPSLGDEMKGSEDLINFLEGKLDQHEKNLVAKQMEYDNLQSEYQSLQDKFSLTKQKYKRAAFLLTELLDDLISKNPSLWQVEREVTLDVDKVRSTPIE